MFKTNLFYLVVMSLFKKCGAALGSTDKPSWDGSMPVKGLQCENS